MNVTIGPVRFTPGKEPVAFELIMPFGTKLTVQTTQSALTARAGGATWSDAHVAALAQAFLTDRYPDAGFEIT